MTIEEAKATLRDESKRRFEEWLRPDGKPVDVRVFPSYELPSVKIHLLADGRWEYVDD